MSKPEFIGIEALRQIAVKYSDQIHMSAVYYRPDVFERMGIEVITGIQFQEMRNLLNRKAHTTRRKVVGDTLKSQLGYLEERVLETQLTWNRYLDNTDNYREKAVVDTTGTNQTYKYPLSEIAVLGIRAQYGEDLFDNLFHGDSSIPNKMPDGVTDNPAAAFGLYDGFITNVRKDITTGRISEATGNYIELPAIAAPVDGDDIEAWSTFKTFVNGFNPALRNAPKVLVWCTPETAMHIADAYQNAHRNNKAIYTDAGIQFPEFRNIWLVDEASLGKGDMLLASTPKNFQYGVDSLNDKSYVKVQEGSDNDATDIFFQVQSNQGTRLFNPNARQFCMSSGTLTRVAYAGDYEKNTFTVTSNDTAMGTVAKNPNQDDYKKDTVVTITATPAAGHVFLKWSDGSTQNPRTVKTLGQPQSLTAYFEPGV